MEYLLLDPFTPSSMLFYLGILCALTGSWKMQKIYRHADKDLFHTGGIIMYFSDLFFASAVMVYLLDGVDLLYGIIIFAVCSFCIPAAGFLISKAIDDKNGKPINH